MNAPKTRTKTFTVDSDNWKDYQPIDGDVVVATYPKAGTTWVIHIVSMLLRQSTKLIGLKSQYRWIDKRKLRSSRDIDMLPVKLKLKRPKILKSHCPLDSIPIYENLKYIHVARDGRDACLSYMNHMANFTEQTLHQLDFIGIHDLDMQCRFPRISGEKADDEFRHFFRDWVTQPPISESMCPLTDFFAFEKSFWNERHRENVLMLHYADLKRDLPAQVRRIAIFLGLCDLSDEFLCSVCEAASFQTMRSNGDRLLRGAKSMWKNGAQDFFNKGQTGRWKDMLTAEDIALYEARAKEAGLSQECWAWLCQL